MNGRLMNLIQEEIQSNATLLAAMQRPQVLVKLTTLAENIFKINDEETMAPYANDEDLKPFIEALQPIVTKFQQDEETQFEQQIKELKDTEKNIYKNDEQYKRMELLISGYIRTEFYANDENNTQKSLNFMVKICAKMCYISYMKLKQLCGDVFIKKQENDKNEIEMVPASFEHDIIGNDFILFYFSGCWCPPSKQFTPKLAAFHSKCIEAGVKLQIIFISSDRGEQSFEKYYKEYHGEYLALPWKERERQQTLADHFSNEYIPAVYVTNDQAQIIDNDARWTVINDEKNSGNAVAKWKKRNEKLKKTI